MQCVLLVLAALARRTERGLLLHSKARQCTANTQLHSYTDLHLDSRSPTVRSVRITVRITERTKRMGLWKAKARSRPRLRNPGPPTCCSPFFASTDSSSRRCCLRTAGIFPAAQGPGMTASVTSVTCVAHNVALTHRCLWCQVRHRGCQEVRRVEGQRAFLLALDSMYAPRASDFYRCCISLLAPLLIVDDATSPSFLWIAAKSCGPMAG